MSGNDRRGLMRAADEYARWSSQLRAVACATDERRAAVRAGIAAEESWRVLVADAAKSGVPAEKIAEAAGISRSRVYQISASRNGE
jgi:hypothetical protein